MLGVNSCQNHPKLKRPKIPECVIVDGNASICFDSQGNRFERVNFGNRDITPAEEIKLLEYTKGVEACFVVCHKRNCKENPCDPSTVLDP